MPFPWPAALSSPQVGVRCSEEEDFGQLATFQPSLLLQPAVADERRKIWMTQNSKESRNRWICSAYALKDLLILWRLVFDLGSHSPPPTNIGREGLARVLG